MTEQQKEILQAQLNSEKRTLKELEQVYKQALKDVEKKIAEETDNLDDTERGSGGFGSTGRQ